ncbi:MAG: hypothetical protein QOJ76_290 [Acidobacteriota bacterium]|nr:hypothetical protein [Acidobacteriota bacterium]
MDELHDGDGDGAEQEDVDETFFAENEFPHEPRREKRRRKQPDVQVILPTPSRALLFRGGLDRALRQLDRAQAHARRVAADEHPAAAE